MNTVTDPQISSVLQDLHSKAAGDALRWRAAGGAAGGALIRLGDLYLGLSPDEGRRLYMLARLSRAQHIVEFGASFGISTLYLAAAAQDNGGKVTTTEVHPDKCQSLRQSFANAGVCDRVTLLEGDARETLKQVTAPIDMLFLDGWKRMYLPIFRLLRPALAHNALILADNCDHPKAHDYLEEVAKPCSGLISSKTGDLMISYLAG